MTRKTIKAAEQRQAEREALLTTLGEKVAALGSSTEWLAYLRFVAAFRAYSVNNLLLIAAQCPHATRVAGYRKWQELSRQVRKGERAIKILGYHQEDHPHRPRDRRGKRRPPRPLPGAVGVRHLPDRRRSHPPTVSTGCRRVTARTVRSTNSPAGSKAKAGPCARSRCRRLRGLH
jgi:hypothetical protein